ncbi:MAG: hypothetical protein ACR2N2_08605 [Acidimicrobiia bacterium]
MDNTNHSATTEMTWEADGEEYQLVRFTDVPRDRAGMVEFLGEVMNCSRLEAEHAYRLILEDGEFVNSVQADIDSLPTIDE